MHYCSISRLNPRTKAREGAEGELEYVLLQDILRLIPSNEI